LADAVMNETIKPQLLKDDILAIVGDTTHNLAQIQSRFKALGHYMDTPVPSRAEHLWRYSDPAAFFPRGSAIPQRRKEAPPDPDGPEVYGDIVLLPDRAPLIRIDDEDAGKVEVAPLSSSPEGWSLLGRAVPLDHGIFESLNAAVWTEGIFIKIHPGAPPDRALHLVRQAGSGIAATRVVVSVEPGAEATLLEEHAGGGGESNVYATTEIFLAENARLTHALYQRWDTGTVGHLTSRTHLERDALLNTAVISLGGTRYKADIGAVLNGVGAESQIVGVSLSDKRKHMDLHTVHDHRGPRTRSRIAYKAALFDRSTSAYTGLIRVAKTAEHSEAFQENRNLLLSDRCQADAIPELEIETSEVQCTHAATAAPMDDAQLFYLKSRGIPEADAIATLVRGFFEDALQPVPEALRPTFEAAVGSRLTERYGGSA
jgi:Fe-S cluster assembly protein SufD